MEDVDDLSSEGSDEDPDAGNLGMEDLQKIWGNMVTQKKEGTAEEVKKEEETGGEEVGGGIVENLIVMDLEDLEKVEVS